MDKIDAKEAIRQQLQLLTDRSKNEDISVEELCGLTKAISDLISTAICHDSY